MTSKSAQSAQHTPPLSPTASFYDLSDDEEGEYNTIMHSSSGRGVKLLFSKSKVGVAFSLERSEHKLTVRVRSMYILHRPRKIIFQAS